MKDRTVRFRLEDRDYEELVRLSEGQGMSEWLRSVIWKNVATNVATKKVKEGDVATNVATKEGIVATNERNVATKKGTCTYRCSHKERKA